MIRVLYVDDEASLLEICQLYLVRTGDFRVEKATSAQIALEMLKQSSYDAIVSDYQMPGMDGIEFLKVLRKDHPTLPFIIFTGKGREEIAVEAFENGADFYIQKGGDAKAQFAELAHKIRKAVQLRNEINSLAENEIRFRALIENASDIIRILDQEGKIVFDTKVSQRVLGYPPGYTIGKSPFDFIHPDDREQLQRDLAEVYEKTNTGTPSEFRIRKADGSYVWAEATGANLLGVPGVDGVVVTTRIIDERKKAEEALRESQEQLNAAMALANLVNWEFDVASGIFTFNDRFYALYATTADREGGYQIPAEVYAREFVHPDERSLVATEVQNAINATDPGYTRQIEHRIIRRDGEIRHIIVRFAITKDAKSRTVKTHGANQDITERKLKDVEMQELLANVQKEREKLSSLVNSISDEVWFTDTSGQFTLENPAAVREFNLSTRGNIDVETLAKSLEVLRPDGTPRPVNEAPPLRALAGEVLRSVEEIVRTPATDEMRYRQVSASPVRDASGTIIGSVSVVRDITDMKRVEAALKESETRFRELFENMSSGVAVYEATFGGKDFIIRTFNRAAEQIEKIGRKEVIGRPVTTVFTGIQEMGLLDVFRRVWQTGVPEHYPVTQYRDNRISGWRDNYVYKLPSGEIVAIYDDVTPRMQALESLRESEEKYRYLFENAVIGIYQTARDGTLLNANDALARMYGYTDAHEILAAGINVGRDLYTNPSDRVKVLTALRENGWMESREFPVLNRDKKQFWVAVTARAVTAPDGSIRYYEGTNIDVTERRHAEEALRESDQFTKEIIASAKEGIIVYDRNFNYVVWNAFMESLTGIPAADVLGKNAFAIFPHLKEQKVDMLLQRALNGETVKSHDTPYTVPKTNKSGWVSGIYGPQLNSNGEIVGVIGIVRDISERKTLEETIRVANTKLHLLSSITRHDILNQLLALRGYLDLSHEHLNDPEKLKEFLEQEEKAAETIERQIRFTKQYQDLGIAAPAWQNVHSTVKNAEKGLPMRDIGVNIDRTDCEVFADPLFEKVFYNLIDNALRYGGDAMKTIRVSLQESDNHLTIVCEDDGVGVPDDDKQRIFDKGFGKNSGFGLFLVKEILSITGITIAETGEPGKGARFEITVPKGAYRFTGAK